MGKLSGERSPMTPSGRSTSTPLANANRAATWYRERMLENEEWCERFVDGLRRIEDATPEGARNIAKSLLDDWHAGSTFADDDLLPQQYPKEGE